MRFEVVHVYLAQHCLFLPLTHVPAGIQNASATSKKEQQQKTAFIKEIQVHKLWTEFYSQKGSQDSYANVSLISEDIKPHIIKDDRGEK